MEPAEAPKSDSVDALASTLNQLVQTCRDGEQGFQAAAQGVDDPNLQHLFQSYAQQRGEFAAELEEEVERLGQKPAEGGPLTAALHQGWTGIRAAGTGRDEGAIISECGRWEDIAVRGYQEALSTSLPADLRALVERQLMKIKEAHDQVRSLEQVHSRHT
jgi:uncharacterized protein (TIGR02284 family)